MYYSYINATMALEATRQKISSQAIKIVCQFKLSLYNCGRVAIAFAHIVSPPSAWGPIYIY